MNSDKVLFIVFLTFFACGKDKGEKANKYYDDFSAIVTPYKDGTERILIEAQTLLQDQLNASGNLKLSREDSIRQRELLKEFENLAEATLEDLNDLEPYPESDLKASAIEYVKTSSSAVVGAFRAVALPMQNAHQPPDPHLMDSLSEKFSNDLNDSNEKFAEKQIEFLEEFEVLN